MDKDIELKAISVKKKLEKEFSELNEGDLDAFFEKFVKAEPGFIKYYNKTVLDKEKIDFGKFKGQWAIQGMRTADLTKFNDNYEKFKEEIEKEKNLQKFFNDHCCDYRKECSFCSKLFHTILPKEFPPVDNPTKEWFDLGDNGSVNVEDIRAIKRGYELFIENNPEQLERIRLILSKNKFSCLRTDELSDIRILDMYVWYKQKP